MGVADEYIKDRRVQLIGVGVIALLLGFLFGFLAGYYGPGDDPSHADQLLGLLTREADDSISQRLMDEIKAENIRANLARLTSRTHLAGTESDYITADELRVYWESLGMKGYVVPYTVLLSYPPMNDSLPGNAVYKMNNETGAVLHKAAETEDLVWPADNMTGVVPHFNAYSPAGTVEGRPVYVNYGREEDFEYLRINHPNLVNGNVCISRYGAIYRGDKARFAQQYGCTGLLLYSDPKDYASEDATSYYPDTWWLPPTGVQRGSIKSPGTAYGDPLTPGYASIDSAFRRTIEDSPEIPTIVVQPIGYGDAQYFLQNMAGVEAPPEWQGNLNNTVYRLGPGYVDSDNWTVKIEVHNTYEQRVIYNAFGLLPGEIEPDRYVMMGNHRDAWVVGAADPTSGTSSMMEISRAMSVMYNQGWRPRRSIIFCSWGGEEHGLIGSTEWAEEYRRLLSDRSVAYFNLDTAVNGNVTMSAGGVPLLFSQIYDAAKMVPNPNKADAAAGLSTVYDSWKKYYPEKDSAGQLTGRPKINSLGAGSDMAALMGKVGVPSLDLSFNSASYGHPLYHSAYDSFHAMTMIDPEFLFHQAAARVTAEVLRNLADSYLLSFDINEYSKVLDANVQAVIKDYGTEIDARFGPEPLVHLTEAADYFGTASADFTNYYNSVDKSNPIQTRALNDQIIHLERVFIDPFGLPGREDIRHLVAAPSQFNMYAGVSFPGIADTMYSALRTNTTEDWNAVAQQVAAITYAIHAAGTTLHQTANFMASSSVPAPKSVRVRHY